MAELEEIYNESLKYYNEIADLTESIYRSLKKNNLVKISKKNLFENFDLYIQSLLLQVAFSDGRFDVNEFEFIRKIVRYKDHLKSYLNLSEEDIKLNLFKRCEEVLKEVPLFIQMIASADKALEIEGTDYSRQVFKKLLLLVMGLAKIDEVVEQAEIKESILCFEPIINFYIANDIKFMSEE